VSGTALRGAAPVLGASQVIQIQTIAQTEAAGCLAGASQVPADPCRNRPRDSSRRQKAGDEAYRCDRRRRDRGGWGRHQRRGSSQRRARAARVLNTSKPALENHDPICDHQSSGCPTHMTHLRRDFLKGALLAPAPALLGADRAADPAAVIRKVEAIAARVPYRSTFVIGRGLVATGGQTGQYVYVRVEAADGRVGWGETIALPSWSYETVESIVSTVQKHLAPIVTGRSAFDQAYFLKQFDEVLTPAVSQGFPFAKAAVQMATLDLAGRIAGLPLHRFWVASCATKLS
jgi:mandelate racemase/muconate lactonizing enzyme-like protein